ncbi:MAG TPA: hypothetical protein VH475_10400, partial [Tepidisphaeraceae bacterium]
DQTYFVPSTVKLRAPSQVIDDAEKKQPLAVYADITKREEFKTRTGTQKLENVPLYWVKRENVSMSVNSVTANLDIRARDVTYEIASVPIFKETPAGLEERFKVDYTASITNVKVTGPAEQIEQIRNGTFKVKAVMVISGLNSSTGDRPNSTDLKYELPQGVSLAPGSDRVKWEYRLIERER